VHDGKPSRSPAFVGELGGGGGALGGGNLQETDSLVKKCNTGGKEEEGGGVGEEEEGRKCVGGVRLLDRSFGVSAWSPPSCLYTGANYTDTCSEGCNASTCFHNTASLLPPSQSEVCVCVCVCACVSV